MVRKRHWPEFTDGQTEAERGKCFIQGPGKSAGQCLKTPGGPCPWQRPQSGRSEFHQRDLDPAEGRNPGSVGRGTQAQPPGRGQPRPTQQGGPRLSQQGDPPSPLQCRAAYPHRTEAAPGHLCTLWCGAGRRAAAAFCPTHGPVGLEWELVPRPGSTWQRASKPHWAVSHFPVFLELRAVSCGPEGDLSQHFACPVTCELCAGRLGLPRPVKFHSHVFIHDAHLGGRHLWVHWQGAGSE